MRWGLKFLAHFLKAPWRKNQLKKSGIRKESPKTHRASELRKVSASYRLWTVWLSVGRPRAFHGLIPLRDLYLFGDRLSTRCLPLLLQVVALHSASHARPDNIKRLSELRCSEHWTGGLELGLGVLDVANLVSE